MSLEKPNNRAYNFKKVKPRQESEDNNKVNVDPIFGRRQSKSKSPMRRGRNVEYESFAHGMTKIDSMTRNFKYSNHKYTGVHDVSTDIN